MITNLVITAFCCCVYCCGKNAIGITANGVRPQENHTIACNFLPFGSRIRIGRTLYTVEDRMSKRFPWRIDIYVNDHRKALKFGIKTNQVEILP